METKADPKIGDHQVESPLSEAPMDANVRATTTGVIQRMLSRSSIPREARSLSASERRISAAGRATAPLYQHITVDGDEGDHDYAKSAALIAKIVQSRQLYKGMDQGQAEDGDAEENKEATEKDDGTASAGLEERLRQVIEKMRNPENEAEGGDHLKQEGDENKPETGERASASRSCEEAARLLGLRFTDEGVFTIPGLRTKPVSWAAYVQHVQVVYGAIESGPCLSTARTRLTAMAEKYKLYRLLNGVMEDVEDPVLRGGGVYAPCTRVDNMVRLRTSMTAPVLLDYVVTTAAEQPRTPLFRDAATGETVTLTSYLAEGGVHDPKELTVEGLGLHPTMYRNKFLPYDMFDAQLNPAGPFGATLLQALLSTEGPSHGDLCGGLVRAEMEKREYLKHQLIATEMMLDVCGHHPDEMAHLAAWVHRQGFNKFSMNHWVVCIHRHQPPELGPNALPWVSATVADQLQSVFYPLFMATLFPHDPAYEAIAHLLEHTGAIAVHTHAVTRTENMQTKHTNPAKLPLKDTEVGTRKVRGGGCEDYYFFYHVWANLCILNALRRRLGLHTLRFVPSVYEQAPAYDQLVCSYLLGDVVRNASSLPKSWIMQFLYTYCGVGVVLSPLRDNALSTAFFAHPIISYLQRGMRVSVSTSEPLYFHHRESLPLLEEYATLGKLCGLTPMDLMELARNSVLNSSFPRHVKGKWLGQQFTPLGSAGNEMSRSGVCGNRLQFRHESLAHEESLLNKVLAKIGAKGPGQGGEQGPLTVRLIPSARSVLVSDLVQHFRQARRMNYTDQRVQYPRVDIYGGGQLRHALTSEAVGLLRQVLALRRKYAHIGGGLHGVGDSDVRVEDVFLADREFKEDDWEYNTYYGVSLLSRRGMTPAWPSFIPTYTEFVADMEAAKKAVSTPALQRLAAHRLELLGQKYLLHLSMNISNESGRREEKSWNNRDFFTAYKVDNNVQTDWGSNARTLLEFFIDKAIHHGDDVVHEENAHPITLSELLQRHHILVDHLTVDELHHHLHAHPELRGIFLSPFNLMQGRYFAELTKKTLDIYQEDAYSFAENRLVISGRAPEEWTELAQWFDRYGMASSRSRWMISLPRQYRRLRQQNVVKNFGEYLDHIFLPLWEVSLHPARDAKFHYFLTHVSGFDSVGDESKIDLPLADVPPHDWKSTLNPPYNYYLYYLWANLTSLNEFRASRGLTTFTLRPQCGEVGSPDHLIGGFCLANSINHGLTLAKHPVMQYLWYVAQVGVAMSPLSNTAAACAYLENPFPIFFHRGLNVSLATYQPLYYHFTREPLVEEYSIAAKLWEFEFNDLSEIARNSVLQSGFPATWKAKALGALYQLHSSLGNDVRKSRVSDIRVAYRYEVYHTEMNWLDEQLMGGGVGGGSETPTSGARTPQRTQANNKGRPPAPPLSVMPMGKLPRAMRLLEEELALSTSSAMYALSQDKKKTSNQTTEKDTRVWGSMMDGMASSSSSSPGQLRAEEAQREVARLSAELERMQRISLEMAVDNSTLAEQIYDVRQRLGTEGLVIQGGFGKVN